MPSEPTIYIDADGCPVKPEVYRVAARYALWVKVVANSGFDVPQRDRIELIIVSGRFDAADDYIAEHAGRAAIVVTEDIPLAARCLEAGALVLNSRGRRFDEDGIGDALASRELMQDLRAQGIVSGGPPPYSDRDRSNFLQMLDQLVHAARKALR